MSALFEKAPVSECSPYGVGDTIDVYPEFGERLRLKVVGIRPERGSYSYVVIDTREMTPYCLTDCRSGGGDDRQLRELSASQAELSIRLMPHPNLVRSIAAFRRRGELFFLTEYCQATPLELRLKEGPLDQFTAVKYSIHLCRALVAIQRSFPGYTHGRLGPSSCLINLDGSLILSDLGNEYALEIGNETLSVWEHPPQIEPNTGRQVDSVEAPDPKRVEKFGTFSHEFRFGDVYAFGLTMYQMLSADLSSAIPQIPQDAEIRVDPDRMLTILARKKVSPELVDVVEQCLKAERGNLSGDFTIFEAELQRIARLRFSRAIPEETAAPLTKPEIIRRAISLTALRCKAGAAEYIDAAMGGEGLTGEMFAWKGNFQLVEGRTDDADIASMEALRKGSVPSVALLARARILIAGSRLYDSLELVARALRMDPYDQAALNLMGDIMLRLGEFGEATSFLNKSLLIDRLQPKTLALLARSKAMNGETEAAIEFSRRAIELDPSDGEVRGVLGRAFFSRGERIKAIGSFKAAIRSVRAGSVESNEAARQFVRCSSDFIRSTAGSVGFRTLKLLTQATRIVRGSAIRSNEVSSFLKGLIKSLQVKDLAPCLLFCLDDSVVASVEVGDETDLAELADHLDKFAVERRERPLSFNESYSLTRILFHLGNYDKCRSLARESLTRFGTNEGPHYYLAACSEKLGDFKEARINYRAAVRILGRENARAGLRRVNARLARPRKTDTHGFGSRLHSFIFDR